MTFARMSHDAVQIVVDFNYKHSLDFNEPPSGRQVRQELSVLEGIPLELILISQDGQFLQDDEVIRSESSTIYLRAVINGGLAGGKGGFGAMLKAQAKQSGKKKTTDFGACRDLSGRRLRHVNDEKILQKWKEAKDRGDDFDVEQETPTGIEMWYMGTPSWADGIKVDHRKKFMKSRTRTKMCMDWIRARKDRKCPMGAPAWWGCPRGKGCEFAHGDEELRGQMRILVEDDKNNIKKQEMYKKRDAYVGDLSQQDEGNALSDMVLQGMRAQKKARVAKASSSDLVTNFKTSSVQFGDIMDYTSFGIDSEAAVSAEILPVSLSAESASKLVLSISTNAETASKPVVVDDSFAEWLAIRSGNFKFSDGGVLESDTEFATLAVCCEIIRGKWYFEVELLTEGLMQIGWADNLFRSGKDFSPEDGVGDDSHSWAYDGMRGKKWNGTDVDYGHFIPTSVPASTLTGGDINISSSSSRSSSSSSSSSSSRKSPKVKTPAVSEPTLSVATVGSDTIATSAGVVDNESDRKRDPWKVGDIVGCIIDISCSESGETNTKISFTLNGEDLGLAYNVMKASVAIDSTAKISNSKTKSKSKSKSKVDTVVQPTADPITYYYPCLSLTDSEAVFLNIGQRDFSYIPKGDIHSLLPLSITSATPDVSGTSPCDNFCAVFPTKKD